MTPTGTLLDRLNKIADELQAQDLADYAKTVRQAIVLLSAWMVFAQAQAEDLVSKD